jgi:membrane-anchored protein YejM (alkaline phosphatase superfamily)
VPVFKNSLVFEIARGIKAFLNVEAGITRGEIPEPGSKPAAPGKSRQVGNPRRSDPSAFTPSSVDESPENFLLVTYDSCRFDAYQEAKTPAVDAHAKARQAWTQATHTYASHASMFQGFLPHVFTEEEYYNRYVRQLWRIKHRRPVEARVVLPPDSRNIIEGFNQLGYFTCGTGAMAWFRRKPDLQQDWQAWQWTGTAARQQVDWITDQLRSRPEQPFFAFINFGETHFPYKFDGQAGLEGDSAARVLGCQRTTMAVEQEHAFDETMWRMQVACAEFLDERMGELLAFFGETGRNVTVVMCSDHGECFGEQGLYGHGFYHPKVMEVPMAIFDFSPDTANDKAHRREEVG